LSVSFSDRHVAGLSSSILHPVSNQGFVIRRLFGTAIALPRGREGTFAVVWAPEAPGRA